MQIVNKKKKTNKIIYVLVAILLSFGFVFANLGGRITGNASLHSSFASSLHRINTRALYDDLKAPQNVLAYKGQKLGDVKIEQPDERGRWSFDQPDKVLEVAANPHQYFAATFEPYDPNYDNLNAVIEVEVVDGIDQDIFVGYKVDDVVRLELSNSIIDRVVFDGDSNGLTWDGASIHGRLVHATQISFELIYVGSRIDKITMSVAKRSFAPAPIAPQAMVAIVGQQLRDLSIPQPDDRGAWVWRGSTSITLNTVGSTTQHIDFRPNLEYIDDYEGVQNQEIIVRVYDRISSDMFDLAVGQPFSVVLPQVVGYTGDLPNGLELVDYEGQKEITGTPSLAGRFEFDLIDSNDGVVASIETTVKKGTLSPTKPDSIDAFVGQKLGHLDIQQVDSRGVWAFVDLDTVVTQSGEYPSTFTPSDTDNYELVVGQYLTVTATTLDDIDNTDFASLTVDQEFFVELPTPIDGVQGDLPDGLSLADNTIVGRPTKAQSFEFGLTASGVVVVTISGTVNKGIVTLTMPTNLIGYHGQALSEIVFESVGGGHFEWVDGDQRLSKDKATYSARFVLDDPDNYELDTANTTFDIEISVSDNGNTDDNGDKKQGLPMWAIILIVIVAIAIGVLVFVYIKKKKA